MKTILKAVLLFTLLQQAAAQDIETSRGQVWTRLSLAPSFNKGFGAYLSLGMRENFSIDKKVNGKEKSVSDQGSWLKELMAGPSWATKINSRTSFKTMILYRPQYWYSDNQGGDSYFRHTLMNSNNIFQKFDKVKLHHRLVFWGLFETEQGKKEYNNELIIRYMFGPELALGKKFALSLKVEPFIKVTADENDIDGTEIFNRFVTWTGFDFKPVKTLKLSLLYVNMQIYPRENIHIKDHYIYAHISYSPKLKRKQ